MTRTENIVTRIVIFFVGVLLLTILDWILDRFNVGRGWSVASGFLLGAFMNMVFFARLSVDDAKEGK